MPVRPWGIAGYREEDQAQLIPAGRPNLATRSLDPYRQPLMALLQLVVSNGTGRAAQLGGFAAGKTGTTQNNRDAWFIGFNESLVVGVWVGNDDDTPMNAVTGGSLPATIWKNFLTAASPGGVAAAAPVEPAGGDIAPAASPTPGVDETPAGSIGQARSGDFSPLQSANAAGRCNVNACARTYRSFRLSDCSYQPWDRGPRRVCDKPPATDVGGGSAAPGVALGYSDGRPDPTLSPPFGYAANPPAASAGPSPPGYGGSPRCNIAACAATRHTFRPSDCTYQPYGGGPRRICED